MKLPILPALLGLAAAVAAITPVRALTIVPTFDASMSASSINVIDSAIAFYEATFADPFTVNLKFYNGGGLGQTAFGLYTVPYSSFRSALAADATTVNDAIALASTPLNGGNNPVDGGASIYMKSANARALGFSVTDVTFSVGACNGYTGDACIGLNLPITNDLNVGTGSGYSLISVAEHEMDEALGLGSSLGLSLTTLRPSPEDLFRFASSGVRSFATYTCGSEPNAYLSIDGGTTLLNQFNNCNNGGDYGDWVSHIPGQVQDAFGNVSYQPVLTRSSAEVVALDAIGYDLIPEPASLTLLAGSLLATFAARRRRAA